MQYQRLNNSATTAKYRVTFNDLAEMIATSSHEAANKIEPHNYGSSLVQYFEDGFILDIFID